MGTYRNISLTFWTDAKIDDDFSPHEKYMYLYLLTNPHTNICGCYQIAQNQMTRETGLDWPEVEGLLGRMQDVHDVIRYCPETKEVLLINWGRYNWSASPKVRDSVLAVLAHIRNPGFREYVYQAAAARWTDLKKESTKEKTGNSTQETVHSTQDTEDSNSNRRYRYPMDRVSETGRESVRDEEFEQFWSVYPRQIHRAEARSAFEQADATLETLLAAVTAQKSGQEWQKEGGRFIPAPDKWLRDRRWNDTPATTDQTFVPGAHELEAVRRMMERRTT